MEVRDWGGEYTICIYTNPGAEGLSKVSSSIYKFLALALIWRTFKALKLETVPQIINIISGLILIICSDISLWNTCHIDSYLESSDKETNSTLIVDTCTWFDNPAEGY